jgi:hypothetical protein
MAAPFHSTQAGARVMTNTSGPDIIKNGMIIRYICFWHEIKQIHWQPSASNRFGDGGWRPLG